MTSNAYSGAVRPAHTGRGLLGHSQWRADPLDVLPGMSWMLFLVAPSASRTYYRAERKP